MRYFGYSRVSTKVQKADRGIDEINNFCEKSGIQLARPVFIDKQTGKNFNRERYTVLKEDVLQPGDVLIIPELDRLGRNKAMILKEIQYFKDNGIRVMILELPTTLISLDMNDTTLNRLILDTIMNMIVEIYACMAEAELEKKTKRQREGIEVMKTSGKWDLYGRPNAIEWDKFKEIYVKVEQGEIKPFAAIKKLGISQPTYYRYRDKYKNEVCAA